MTLTGNGGARQQQHRVLSRFQEEAGCGTLLRSYWRLLHMQLKQTVPELYKIVFSDYTLPIVLTRDQFFLASAVLNNVCLIPKKNAAPPPASSKDDSLAASSKEQADDSAPVVEEFHLPSPPLPGQSGCYAASSYEAFFETRWETLPPNLVVGYPEIKACANHRMEVVAQYDFLAWGGFEDIPEFLPIHTSCVSGTTGSAPQQEDGELKDFFRALTLFKRTAGVNSLGIFDFSIENKSINVARRYVSSKEEYECYWEQNVKLNQQLLNNRKTHCRCFWCYQSFLGLTCQGMSKGLLYDRVDHIPRAMKELQACMKCLKIPLYYISKTIIQYLGSPLMEDSLPAYNKTIDKILSSMLTDDKDLKEVSASVFSDRFESRLHCLDMQLLDMALAEFQQDLTLTNSSFQTCLVGTTLPAEPGQPTMSNHVAEQEYHPLFEDVQQQQSADAGWLSQSGSNDNAPENSACRGSCATAACYCRFDPGLASSDDGQEDWPADWTRYATDQSDDHHTQPSHLSFRSGEPGSSLDLSTLSLHDVPGSNSKGFSSGTAANAKRHSRPTQGAARSSDPGHSRSSPNRVWIRGDSRTLVCETDPGTGEKCWGRTSILDFVKLPTRQDLLSKGVTHGDVTPLATQGDSSGTRSARPSFHQGHAASAVGERRTGNYHHPHRGNDAGSRKQQFAALEHHQGERMLYRPKKQQPVVTQAVIAPTSSLDTERQAQQSTAAASV